ncbi:DUF6270 domain-containing protein [Terribacillus sp. 7520-G]|uniref:DUF6270 domain-containing protein n=1 Tax=Terribacillus TaxID=459532 RepID=UPI000BA73127|nr:DUF6270 domain-containing protein [Terribacillus sp. 7520-G]PAD38438.1 hypothetical protein CHH53_11095 [Terribacillus sp. 7520-G]
MTVKIACYGSCITRDNFNSKLNKNYKERYECVATSLHTSIISLVSPQVPFDEAKLDHVDIKSADRNKRIVMEELNRTFLDDLKESQPDYLIMDFFPDIYFGVVFSQDRIFTNNDWYITRTSFYREMQEKFILDIGDNSTEYLSVWLPSIHKFMEFVKEHVPNCEVIINKGRFSNRLMRDDGNISYLTPFDGYNEVWNVLDNFVVSKYDLKYIELDHSEYYISSKPTLGWDIFQLHYQDDYYHDFLKQLDGTIRHNAGMNA